MSSAQQKKIEAIQSQIDRIKADLAQLGPMRPGSITRQYRKPVEKKGAFYQISYTHRMKSRTEHLRPENLIEARQQTAAFKRFKKLVARWIDLALELSRLQVSSTPK